MKHDLEILRNRAAHRIQANLVIDDQYRSQITRLLWWCLLLKEQWANQRDHLETIAEISMEIQRLDNSGFFQKDQRKPLRAWEVMRRCEAELGRGHQTAESSMR